MKFSFIVQYKTFVYYNRSSSCKKFSDITQRNVYVSMVAVHFNVLPMYHTYVSSSRYNIFKGRGRYLYVGSNTAQLKICQMCILLPFVARTSDTRDIGAVVNEKLTAGSNYTLP